MLNRNLVLYLDIPFCFHTNSKSNTRINANASQKVILPVTHEILKINFDKKKNCKEYSNSYIGSYDECKITAMEKMLQVRFNCTVPFLMKSGPLCDGKTAKNASQIYDHVIQYGLTNECPRPCHKIIPTFGLPRYYSPGNESGKIRLYFHNIVKVTEDFVSYDLLR